MEADRRPPRHRRPPHSRSSSRLEGREETASRPPASPNRASKNVSHAARVQEIAHTPPDALHENTRQPRRRNARAVGGASGRAPRKDSQQNSTRDVQASGAPQMRRPLWRRLRRFACFLMLVGLVELGAAALTTKHFAVRAVDVSGAQITPESELQAIAGQLVGQNWIRAKVSEAERAAQALPTVKAAHVVRVLDEWPPRLAMRIEERQAFTRVGGGNTWWVVDREGVLFGEAKAADKSLSALTTSTLDLETLQPGDKLPAKLWASVVELTDALKSDSAAGAQWSLRRTYIDKWGFASLRLTGGMHDEMLVRLGAGLWPEKLQRTRQTLAYFDATGKRASALNLVSFNMPTWTPRGAANNAAASADGDSDTPNMDAQSEPITTPVAPSLEPDLAPDSVPETNGNAAQQPT